MEDERVEYLRLCQQALQISANTGIIIALIVKILFAIVGFVGLIFACFFYDHFTMTFHKNARLLLWVHYLFAMVSCFGTVASDGFDFYRFTLQKSLNSGSKCLIPPMDPLLAISLKILKLFGTSGTMLSMAALTFERLFATIFAKTYQTVSLKFGIFLGFICVSINSIGYGLHFVIADYSHLVYMTTITRGAMGMSLYMLYFSCGIEAFVIIVQCGLFLSNWQTTRGSDRMIVKSLNYKSQIRENVESLKFLFTLSVIHTLLYLLMAVIMPTIANVQNDETQRQLTTIQTETITIYFIALPAVLIWCNWIKKRSDRVHQVTHCIGDNVNRVRMENEKHFKMIDELFQRRTSK
ncbi:hypothetical protein QR680_011075 [Steinernema hermaphroditum]|uniref:Uncharacterized protein n=1 Tax=Steinernema hermaphroditum TaxID=289476 RepID=A0AA39IR07_9BILA|nr:hypothetical protein QR680_011075 [Steinernema hermaphroditum]